MADDYRQEQLDEVESLEAIYPDLFTKLSDDPLSFKLVIVSDESSSPDDPEATSSVTLTVTYTPTYPEEAPVIEISSSLCVSAAAKEKLQEVIKTEIEDNLGMPMVSVVQMTVKEALDEINEQERQRIVDDRIRAKEEAEMKELERLTAGTAVTKESFMAWLTQFQEEMAKKKGAPAKAKASSSKLTGKQLFLTDTKMQTSDSSFMEEGDLDVDRALFSDMDMEDLPDDL
ncbi:hypothetical protein PTSG_02744 [Salpingoeca rosetta]|uniref:RWD domain-containing protein n=1 Tax=Salpingoeca rosetta (strain ATCC 50818 / BSB-021) TaxID=946362 RepID=F2U369_SALR5|nr:uncharacterized protein PTSG_02744 [Salpingoeca rosetta]EGD82063.1 hypothetical protein PTSG_02744 [Salpingoeca rosetta]|eukprot:XP_004996246.1 hypothetical protein PTSG_02744 [Salpingoeca rosetta]